MKPKKFNRYDRVVMTWKDGKWHSRQSCGIVVKTTPKGIVTADHFMSGLDRITDSRYVGDQNTRLDANRYAINLKPWRDIESMEIVPIR